MLGGAGRGRFWGVVEGRSCSLCGWFWGFFLGGGGMAGGGGEEEGEEGGGLVENVLVRGAGGMFFIRGINNGYDSGL